MNYYRFTLITFFTLFTLGASSQSLSSKDLNMVLENTKQYDIIGLGEAEHFHRGYYKFKADLIKYLMQHNASDIIALEASM